MRTHGLLAALLVILPACRAGTVRRPTASDRERPAGVVSLKWRTVVHEHALFEPRAQECAVGAVVRDRLVLGSRSKKIMAISTRDGAILWSTPVPGEIDGVAVYDSARDQVLLGSDDGTLFAVDPESGQIRWRYKGQGALDAPPAISGDRIFFTTAADKLYAVAAEDGSHAWEYERDRPDGFTIHGYAAPQFHDGTLYAGFSDGFLVAFQADDGEVLWARSLASASDQFVDVDSTPSLHAESVIAASYSGGVYALAREDGNVLWRLPIEGATRTGLASDRFFLFAPRVGLHAVDPKNGHILWRRGLPNAGEVSNPVAIGPYVILTGNDAGVYVIDRKNGQILQTFVPGRGMCAGAAVDPQQRMIYVLSNGGSLYALRVSWTSDDA